MILGDWLLYANQNNNADIDKNKNIKIIIGGNNTIVQKSLSER